MFVHIEDKDSNLIKTIQCKCGQLDLRLRSGNQVPGEAYSGNKQYLLCPICDKEVFELTGKKIRILIIEQ